MQNVVLTGNAILEPRTICFRCHIWIELKLFQLVGAYQDIILFLFDLASQKTCQICKYLQVLSEQDNIYLYCFCSCADMDIDTLPGHLLHWIPAFILPCTMSSKSFIHSSVAGSTWRCSRWTRRAAAPRWRWRPAPWRRPPDCRCYLQSKVRTDIMDFYAKIEVLQSRKRHLLIGPSPG